MSQVCQICLKGPAAGQNRSHSKRATKRRFLPNLIRKRIFDHVTGTLVRIRMCTRCNRTMLKQETKKIEKAMQKQA